LIDFALLIG